jgi:hypothetical protein
MADKFKVQDGIEFADGTSMTTAAIGIASTGNITFEGVKIKGAGTASGDGLGYATMELVPDNNLYSSGQYLIIDPTGPNHIHIRAGGLIDQSQSELILGGEKLRVRVYESDGNAGVFNTHQVNLRNNTYNAGTADFGTATYTDDGTTKTITLTTVSQAVLEDIWASNNISFLYAYNGEVQYTFKFQGSSNTQGAGQNASFTVLPNNAADTMPADGTTFTQVSFDLQITRTSRLEIDGSDVNIEAADDVRIYSRDTFLLANYGINDSIQISTQYDTANQKSWYFNSDGNLELPVGGDIIDSTGTSVLGGGGAVPDDSFESKSTATGVVTHDCAINKVFVHSSISADFTANLTNLNLAAGTATNITLVLNQDATAYICNALQIGGVAQTINWQGSSSAPTGNSNKKDVMSFSILNVAGTYTVLGQLVSFG